MAIEVSAAVNFAKYDVILTRRPFGQMVDPAAAAAAAAKEVPVSPQDSFAKHLRMIAVTDDEFGLRVGLYDAKTKKSFFIEVGQESEDGIKLLRADFDEAEAVIQKGSETVTLDIDGKMTLDGGTTVTAPKLPPDVPTMTKPAVQGQTSRAMSYVERLRMRREAMKKAEESRIKAAADELASKRTKMDAESREKLLREYNLELIRAKGEKGTPLPIKLTPEEDAKLVEEGVLPPRQ